MQWIKTISLVLIVLIAGCIEPYEFDIENEQRNLVVEGYISDVSYNETLAYPSDGRYFEIKLSYTSDVTNRAGEDVVGAEIFLISSQGEEWQYSEVVEGQYFLLDECFKASFAHSYKLTINLDNGRQYESEWQRLPVEQPPGVEALNLNETTQLKRVFVGNEDQIREVTGINLSIKLPENIRNSTLYYMWKFEPHWIVRSPLFPTVNYTCWVKGRNYLDGYVLQTDRVGGYSKNMAFVETEGNERLLWDFTLLTKQFIIGEDYYEYLEDIKIQTDVSYGGPLPYNISSNLISKDGNSVDGYFAVVNETARRFYINQFDLSYGLEDKIKTYCQNPLTDKGPICWDCTAYSKGKSSTVKPSWWRD